MNFVNRAIKNVTRRLSKTILLALTFFLIGNLVIIGLGVASAAENAKILTRQKMRAVITYQVDYDQINKYVQDLEDEELDEFYNHYPRVRIGDVQELLKDERVKTANAIASSQVYDVDGYPDFVHLNNRAEENMGDTGQSCYFDEYDNEVCYSYVEPKFYVKGNYFPSMIEIEDGEFNIIEGRFYNQEEINNHANVVLVTSAFAETNGLSVGDRFSYAVTSPSEIDYPYMKNSGVTKDDIIQELEIIGIYTHNHQINPDSENYDYTYPYENFDNMFLMPATTLYAHQLIMSQKSFDYYAEQFPEDEYYQDKNNRPSLDNESMNYISNCTLLLNDPLDVDQFVEDYTESLAQFMKLDANNEQFEQLSKPLDTLSLYANFIIWLVVINAVVIITLVTALTLKTREYEIGVLLSVGASKFKVIMQFFLELAIVAVIGFTLSVGSGSIIAKSVGNKVLGYQIASSGLNEEDDYYYYDDDSIWNTDYSTDISLDDLIAEYEVSVSPVIIGEIYVLGLGIVLVSVLIPSIMIMRFNPKKILMNQN